jgi:hypothetical protein
MPSLLALAAALLGTQEESVNPRYEFWTGCKAGSWVKMRLVTKRDGVESESEMVFTLRELSPDQALLDVEATWKGGKHSTSEKVPRKISFAFKPEGDREEDLPAAGRVLKCRRYAWGVNAAGLKANGKVWMSRAVPGGVVKDEPGDPALPKMEAVAWEKK